MNKRHDHFPCHCAPSTHRDRAVPRGNPRQKGRVTTNGDHAVSKSESDAPDRARFAERFEADVAPLQPVLYRYALRLTRNPADAEDLVQDTMVNAFRGYGKLRPDSYLRAWLTTIMRHTWINTYRTL